jgi:hypothetical protein
LPAVLSSHLLFVQSLSAPLLSTVCMHPMAIFEVALYPGAPRSYTLHPNCHTRVTPESHHSHTIITPEPTCGHFDLNSLE